MNIPARCSNKCIPCALAVTGIKEASGNTKIAKLNIAAWIDENVTSLDVAVDVAVMVKVLQALQHLFENGRNHNLLKPVGMRGFQYVEAGPAGHIRHDHPQIVVADEGAVRFKHVRVVHQDHCLSLTRHVVLRAMHCVCLFNLIFNLWGIN